MLLQKLRSKAKPVAFIEGGAPRLTLLMQKSLALILLILLISHQTNGWNKHLKLWEHVGPLKQC